MTMFSKNDIKSIPFDQLPPAIKSYELHRLAELEIDPETADKETLAEVRAHAREFVTSQFVAGMELAEKHTWLLPQMLMKFGNWSLVFREDGMVDTLGVVKKNCEDPWMNGLRCVALVTRGELIKAHKDTPQYKLPEYCALVPLILGGIKKEHNVPYSKWPLNEHLKYVLDNELYEAMTYDTPAVSKEELLKCREKGLMIATGKRAGQSNNPLSCASLPHQKGLPLENVPRLAKLMLTQIWCAHPANRGALMVLDPDNWDEVPEPLISTDMFITKPAPAEKKTKITASTTWRKPW